MAQSTAPSAASATGRASATGPAPGFLSGVRVIATRELGAYFDSAIAYVYTIAFVALAGSIFMNEFFLAGRADMTPFFDLLPLLLAVFLPAITMRLWAEEAQKRTIELLLTLPIRPAQAVLGKFAAALALYGVFLACTLPIPIMIGVLGDPDVGRIVSGYLGLVLFGAMFLALGMFTSALTGDQIVAYVLATVAGIALVLVGDERVVSVLDGLFPGLTIGSTLYDTLAVLPPYESFVRGLVELPAVLYFVGLSAALLWANALVLRISRA
ncbi:ABC transporter permease [Engelhardtia mirabilis]|uniref:ABC-2 family transporter protein n=1 Tax=Engelhardtia mirabilis TaxID=2528011 RepID=A0A518BI29_9BACT|nr:ABC-2 family transporter protein [Planctomycetes bacterium Pla133]QDV00964.1 ABC-2 family transporter protein [Planctomycetes bacterium Pla86]